MTIEDVVRKCCATSGDVIRESQGFWREFLRSLVGPRSDQG
jgi:hypothetical protein